MTEAAVPNVFAESPAGLLEAVFADIHRERMAGLPVLNDALAVAAVDFTRFEHRWVGVLLTPWFLSLVALPAAAAGVWAPVAEGEKTTLALPSGDYRFTGGHEPRIGPYLSCSLLSPVRDLHAQDDALRLCREVMALLLAPTVDRGAGAAPAPEGAAAPAPCGREKVDTSRRGFLRVDFEPRAGRARVREA